MLRDRLFQVGLIGTVISALCCLTPVLVGVFAAMGLGLIWIDLIVLPFLVLFMGVMVVAVIRRARS